MDRHDEATAEVHDALAAGGRGDDERHERGVVVVGREAVCDAHVRHGVAASGQSREQEHVLLQRLVGYGYGFFEERGQLAQVDVL